ncbi:MAG: MoxR family ATPase [Candidatus Aenigmarchaeota archaeon]|nr:MoxR family ATPase [Candidatus Aenigmarchaeota archaeon]
MDKMIEELNLKAKGYASLIRNVQDEVGKVIVGQSDIVEKTMIALIANGHVLIEGVPGLAKTLLIKTLAQCLDCGFVRLQFTPDLLPADIVGTKIYNHKTSSFTTVKGPVFNNFVLADEINRAPPKVQSALLEAMQEYQVSIQGETFPLKKPFLVLATQNPIELEGTYKLPEAQVDRFMFKLMISYPSKGDEKLIIKRFTQGQEIKVNKAITAKQIAELQGFLPSVYVDEKVEDYVTEIVDATRNPSKYRVDVDSHIEYGASPRASLWLILSSKAHALLNGRGYVIPEDVRAVAHEVLRHRVLLTYEAEAEGVTADDIVSKVLDAVVVP